jgi:DNA excision repair protein ERCC-5
MVQVYLAEDVAKEMGLERDDLVALAYFLGSDYCEGVNGVGIVNALEILQAFPMKSSSGGVLSGLKQFR